VKKKTRYSREVVVVKRVDGAGGDGGGVWVELVCC